MFAEPQLSPGSLSRCAVALALALCLLSSSAASAAPKDKKKKNQPATGKIEVSTQPGGYPVTIDGQPAGETTDYVRVIELEPGAHTVEILFPNDTRWSQVFQIVAGRKNCIALSYLPRTIEVPPFVYPTDPAPPQGGKVSTVDLGDVTGTVCDCGEIPPPPQEISKEGWWGRRVWRKVRRK